MGLTTVVVAGLTAGSILAVTPEEREAELLTHFTATDPTVVVKYSLEYRLGGIRLMRVAQSEVRTTEGLWTTPGNPTNIPVFYMEATIDTYDQADDARRKRISIHDRMVCVLTNPDADTLVYVRAADQYFNLPFSSTTSIKHLKVYNLESGSMDYYHEDYLHGVTNTILSGSTNLIQQGREVALLMKMMSAVYAKQAPHVVFTNSPKIFVDVDETVQPFVAQSRFCDSPVKIEGIRPDSLRVDVKPAPGIKIKRGGHLTIWITSLRELARGLQGEPLIRAASESPSWSIIPLMFQYDLRIGSMYGIIRDIHVAEPAENAPDGDIPLSPAAIPDEVPGNQDVDP